MSSLRTRQQCATIENKALAAEQRINTSNGVAGQLEAAISSAELYMQALKLTDDANHRKRLDSKTRELLLKAEKLKQQSDEQNGATTPTNLEYPLSKRSRTTREKIILLESSKLNGAIFKEWEHAPSDREFDQGHNQELFFDNFEYSLSEMQMKHFDGWERPANALSRIRIIKSGELLPNEATMIQHGTWDFVQDVAPDCSLIASFCVGASRAEKGHRRLFGGILWPFDHDAQRPQQSANGKYILRLYFNGCWRRVEIDDRLPVSKSSRILHVIDRSHPGLIWPSIFEKAYLKVRGGYDFPGSNSSTDVAVLTGWIPQQIFLHDEEVEPDALWIELLSAFIKGDILCTLGTGKLGRREQQQLGLGAEHDYAVLDIRKDTDTREILIKNPWADGDIWKGATRCRPNPGHEGDAPKSPLSPIEGEEMKPGTFWMDFNHVFQHFENLYLNWNPGLFSHREDKHFSWHLPEIVFAGNLLVDHPQFAVRTKSSTEVWLLLNRHFRTGDFSVQNHGKNGYISLYLFENQGNKVFSSEGAKIKGPFVDSPNTLLRLSTKAGSIYSVVVVSQDLPPGKHNFTISAFSKATVELNDAYHTFQDPHSLSAAWTRATAGGSANCSTYLQNPQFMLRAGADARIALVLKSLSDGSTTKPNIDIHVKIVIVASDGKRITKLRQRDITTHSGDYKRGSTVIEASLPKGTYTVVCSTFEPDQLSKFELSYYATFDTSQTFIRALPAEASGRLSIIASPAVFVDVVTKLVAPLTITRMTKALFKARQSQGLGSLLFKMSLEQGQGPYKKVIATSAGDETEFSAISAGLRIEDIDLNSAMTSQQHGGLWLVLEKPSQSSTEAKEVNVLQIEVLTEERIELGAWTPLDG